ncbi:MAG: signal peptidase I [Oscillospiraceae bacterium]|nr:signal peptidase I [Oscillospiraceae bacterium]
MAKKSKKTPEEIERAQKRESYDWIQSIISALIICIVVFLFFVRVIDVSGDSMNPTLVNGEKMVVSGLFYKPKQGDIVIFKTDDYDPDKALVKRVIATEGQVVNIDRDNGIVYVDDEPIQEEYIAELTKVLIDFRGPWTVPEGCVFVMGDNRNQSTDSRDKRIGNVDEKEIIGRAYAVIYPFDQFRIIK